MKVNLLLVYRKHKKDIYDAIEDILFDFPEILDKIIIDIYLKEDIFLRNEILEKISQKDFDMIPLK